MKPRKTYCLDCRVLDLVRAADGGAIYWCAKKKLPLGPTVLGRPACSDFESWQLQKR